MIPQDTDPLRAKARQEFAALVDQVRAANKDNGWAAATYAVSEMVREMRRTRYVPDEERDRGKPGQLGFDYGYSQALIEIEGRLMGLRPVTPDPDPLHVPESLPYPGWSVPRPWYRRIPRSLAAWWRRAGR